MDAYNSDEQKCLRFRSRLWYPGKINVDDFESYPNTHYTHTHKCLNAYVLASLTVLILMYFADSNLFCWFQFDLGICDIFMWYLKGGGGRLEGVGGDIKTSVYLIDYDVLIF